MGYWSGRTRGEARREQRGRMDRDEDRRNRNELRREREYQDSLKRQALQDQRYNEQRGYVRQRQQALDEERRGRNQALQERQQRMDKRQRTADERGRMTGHNQEFIKALHGTANKTIANPWGEFNTRFPEHAVKRFQENEDGSLTLFKANGKTFNVPAQRVGQLTGANQIKAKRQALEEKSIKERSKAIDKTQEKLLDIKNSIADYEGVLKRYESDAKLKDDPSKYEAEQKLKNYQAEKERLEKKIKGVKTISKKKVMEPLSEEKAMSFERKKKVI